MSPWLTLLIFLVTFTVTCALVGTRILAEMGYREVSFLIGIPRHLRQFGVARQESVDKHVLVLLIALPFLHLHFILKKR